MPETNAVKSRSLAWRLCAFPGNFQVNGLRQNVVCSALNLKQNNPSLTKACPRDLRYAPPHLHRLSFLLSCPSFFLPRHNRDSCALSSSASVNPLPFYLLCSAPLSLTSPHKTEIMKHLLSSRSAVGASALHSPSAALLALL